MTNRGRRGLLVRLARALARWVGAPVAVAVIVYVFGRLLIFGDVWSPW